MERNQMKLLDFEDKAIKPVSLQDLWCIHSYYTLCPYAPDHSGRLLLSGADLENNTGEVLIISKEGKLLDKFGRNKLNASFFHTGFWQTWSPDARYVYYQNGTLESPRIVRRELSTGHEIILEGDMEGAPPFGEPIISGLMGMLYAAGYGDGNYHPELSPVEFAKRHEHGLFEFNFEPSGKKLALSVQEIFDKHPFKDKLHASEIEIAQSLGNGEGLTLMAYCVRWNSSGSRFLFYFGNHCVDKKRGEPRLSYVFTCDKDMKEIHLAVDLSYARRGVHWSWHPDGEHLIGYGPDPEDNNRMCLAQVRFDGTDYKRIYKHESGGHPSISPTDHNLLVTDVSGQTGEVLFVDIKSQKVVKNFYLPRVFGEKEPKGRNPFRVCHHPVFSQDGSKVLLNTLPGRNSIVCEIDVKEALK